MTKRSFLPFSYPTQNNTPHFSREKFLTLMLSFPTSDLSLNKKPLYGSPLFTHIS